MMRFSFLFLTIAAIELFISKSVIGTSSALFYEHCSPLLLSHRHVTVHGNLNWLSNQQSVLGALHQHFVTLQLLPLTKNIDALQAFDDYFEEDKILNSSTYKKLFFE